MSKRLQGQGRIHLCYLTFYGESGSSQLTLPLMKTQERQQKESNSYSSADSGIHEPRTYQEPDIGADEYWPPGALKIIYLPAIMR